MARRSNTATAEAEQTPTNEVEDQSTKQGEDTPPQEDSKQEAEAPKEIDLAPFQSAVATAMEDKDESTGELPLAAIEPVNVQYRALDGTKAKNAAKNWLEESMKQALMGMGEYSEPNLQDARGFVQIKDNLTAAKSGGGERKPADPKGAAVNQFASLVLAQYVWSKTPLAEGVDPEEVTNEGQSLADSLTEQADAYLDWINTEVPEGEDKPEAPEVSPVVKAAVKLSSGKGTGGTRGGSAGGPRRDVAKHIAEAFAEREPGDFLSVAQIAKFNSTEYGSDNPSQGAVQARLFPASGKCTVEGVEPVDRTDDSPRGARKVA